MPFSICNFYNPSVTLRVPPPFTQRRLRLVGLHIVVLKFLRTLSFPLSIVGNAFLHSVKHNKKISEILKTVIQNLSGAQAPL